MVNSKHSTKEQLASIVSPHKSGQSVKEISRIVGLAERPIQKWIKRYTDGDDDRIPDYGSRSGRPRKTNERTLNIIRRQVEVNPRSSAREIKRQSFIAG
ncbi:hypothetical protein Pcinc_004483 [Petrolisthes cinctipes]|uniref:Uncharacterized protein n=1 Tax=Petrolisthes cinctipes TaxID=88211 RepID=A0AAE1L030_PETCI|nr:hypothetical protein Pcinc_004483 [Petrolisthes cinctipes]